MNEIEMILKDTIEFIRSHTTLFIALATIPAYGMFFRAVGNIVRSGSAARPKPEKNRVVGHLMTDDEKINYILENVPDTEKASDQIADIYYNQMIKEK